MATAQLSLDVFQPCEPQTNLPYCTYETMQDLANDIIRLVSSRFKDNNRVSLTPMDCESEWFGGIKLKENKGERTGSVLMGGGTLKHPYKIQIWMNISGRKGNPIAKVIHRIPAADNPKLYVGLGDVMGLDGWIFDTFVHECNKPAKGKGKGKGKGGERRQNND